MLERSKLKIDEIQKDFTLSRKLLDVYGIIKEVKDGVVVVKDGLEKVGMSEMVEFVNTGIKGIVNYLGSEKSITVLGSIKNLKVGDLVKRLNILPFIDVNNNWLGRVVDPLGNTLDGLGEIKSTKDSKKLNIEKKAPGIIERESVKDALETGVKFLDAMIGRPLGYYLYCNKFINKKNYKKNFKRSYVNDNKKKVSKIKQFIDSYKELNIAYKVYTDKYLKHYKDTSSFFAIAGFISLFLGPKITLIGIYIYIIALFEFMIAIYLIIYVIVKQIKFIFNYELKCNPKIAVKSVFLGIKMLFPYAYGAAKVTGVTFGSMLSVNWFIESASGVNVLEETGRNCIYGDKDIYETANIIKDKLKKGYRDEMD